MVMHESVSKHFKNSIEMGNLLYNGTSSCGDNFCPIKDIMHLKKDQCKLLVLPMTVFSSRLNEEATCIHICTIKYLEILVIKV
jgi:hypothetical protein